MRKDLGPVWDILGLRPLRDIYEPLAGSRWIHLPGRRLPGCTSRGQEGEGRPRPQMAPQPRSALPPSATMCVIRHPISLVGKLRSCAHRLRFSSKSHHIASKRHKGESEPWASPGRWEAERLGHWTHRRDGAPGEPPTLPVPPPTPQAPGHPVSSNPYNPPSSLLFAPLLSPAPRNIPGSAGESRGIPKGQQGQEAGTDALGDGTATPTF